MHFMSSKKPLLFTYFVHTFPFINQYTNTSHVKWKLKWVGYYKLNRLVYKWNGQVSIFVELFSWLLGNQLIFNISCQIDLSIMLHNTELLFMGSDYNTIFHTHTHTEGWHFHTLINKQEINEASWMFRFAIHTAGVDFSFLPSPSLSLLPSGCLLFASSHISLSLSLSFIFCLFIQAISKQRAPRATCFKFIRASSASRYFI